MRALLVTVVLLFSSAANAYESSLPKGSVLCGDRGSAEEALRAVQRSDREWFASLPACIITNRPVKAQRINCTDKVCRVRFWMLDGRSAVGYAFSWSLAG